MPHRAYSDRSRAPEETVALMRPHFGELGITRLARQTGLDILGIPCFAAIRPNSRSLASNQGKGVTDELAMASAVMEATEFAIAERPEVLVSRASLNDLERRGATCFDPQRAMPLGFAIDRTKPMRWVEGRSLIGRTSCLVPYDLVALNGTAPDLPGICQNTNGLASGNTAAEAIFHAACELVERDAATLWSLMPLNEKIARAIDLRSLRDSAVADLLQRFERADLVVRLFDQTSDIGVPTVMAVCGPRSGRFAKHYDIAAGSGTHPDPVRAALRAITEAAQTRVTAIAGSRDDRAPDEYRRPGNEEAFALLAAEPKRRMRSRHPKSNSAGELLEHVLGVLETADIDDPVCVRLGGERFGISVVRLVSQRLEDRGPNANWRPGLRALGQWLELA